MVVMGEVHKQMNNIAAKQKEKNYKLNAEIHKLKSMIVKHEFRIQALEIEKLFDLRYLQSWNSRLRLDNHDFNFTNFTV